MAGQSYVLDKAYKIEDAAGVGQYLCVVQGAAEGGCKKPAAANATKFLGVTQEEQTNQNKGVAVRKLGITRVVASGVIAAGDFVNIAGATGKVQSCQAAVDAAAGAFAQTNVIGMAETAAAADGNIIQVTLCPFVVKTPAS